MLKIIGAGVGRTGTKSMQLALDQLGFGPCYHMDELFKHAAGVKYWKQAHKTGSTDWDTLLEGYESIVDFPGGMYYKALAEYYPDAKVILTIRDAAQWYDCAMATIYSFEPDIRLKLRLLCSALFSKVARDLIQVGRLNNASIWKKFFEGKFEDRAYAISKFDRYIEEVKTNISAERLLIMNVREGWEPLCRFLNVDMPNIPLPRKKSSHDFSDWANGLLEDALS